MVLLIIGLIVGFIFSDDSGHVCVTVLMSVQVLGFASLSAGRRNSDYAHASGLGFGQ